jgi:hypothetical protein
MEAVCSSETSERSYRTTRRYIIEGYSLESIICYVFVLVFNLLQAFNIKYRESCTQGICL